MPGELRGVVQEHGEGTLDGVHTSPVALLVGVLRGKGGGVHRARSHVEYTGVEGEGGAHGGGGKSKIG